jgi:hypothetical protein
VGESWSTRSDSGGDVESVRRSWDGYVVYIYIYIYIEDGVGSHRARKLNTDVVISNVTAAGDETSRASWTQESESERERDTRQTGSRPGDLYVRASSSRGRMCVDRCVRACVRVAQVGCIWTDAYKTLGEGVEIGDDVG